MKTTMSMEYIHSLIGNPVNLTFKNGFVLTGTIDEASNDFIIFTTKQKTSMLSLESIQSIVPRGDRR